MKGVLFKIVLFSLLLVAKAGVSYERESITYAALDVYDKASPYLAPLITESKYQTIYAKDRDYIADFPFSSYTLCRVLQQGFFFDDGIRDTIKNVLRQGLPWEKQIQTLMKRYVRKNSVVLDIGSHIGTHTVTLSQAAGIDGKVFAFEPNKKIYRELCYNMALNECTNVVPLRVALGKEVGVIEVIASHPENEGGSYVVETKGGENSASLLPLDAFALSNVSFIKIDVENMEEEVLRGAIDTIKRNRPIMLIEIQGNGERPIQLSEDSRRMALSTKRFIISLGYRLQFISGCDYLAFPIHG